MSCPTKSFEDTDSDGHSGGEEYEVSSYEDIEILPPPSEATYSPSTQTTCSIDSSDSYPVNSIPAGDELHKTISTSESNVEQEVSVTPYHAAEDLESLSFANASEARKAAHIVPAMMPFESHEQCHLCSRKFSRIHRASHCRNCGVCVCRRKCTVAWPAKRVPETFNIKDKSSVKICKTCDSLSERFREALMEGDVNEVVSLYKTGHINVRCCFGEYGGETIFPIHAAASGGSLRLLKWLVDSQYCPIFKETDKVVSVADMKKMPILTSKGRSVLTIAMGNANIDIVRYLVVEKGMDVNEMKDLKTALLCLGGALRRLSCTEE